jgi:hypothetical protein
MASALEAAWAKYQRACEDLKTLDADTRRFLDREPYRAAVKFEPETGWHIAHIRILEEPPPTLSVHVGSLAYQCYSALNHVVWQLVVRKVGKKRAYALRNHVGFPLALKPRDFQSLCTPQNVSKPARAVLESLQPYRRPHKLTGHPLLLIKELADADKHRVLAPSYGLADITDIMGNSRFAWDTTVASNPTFRRDLPLRHPAGVPIRMLKDGAEFMSIRFGTGNEHANVRVNGKPTAEIVFESDTWGFTQRRIRDMLATTDRCLTRLATLFPRESWPPPT